MNLLSMVMGLLLIFACAFTLSLKKDISSHKVDKTYEAHMNASRRILNSYESLCYENLRGEKKESEKNEASKKKKEKHIQPLNLSCARLNLGPLVQDGKEKHAILYETAAQILNAFYSKTLFSGEPRFEYKMLDAILAAAHDTNGSTHLEKLSLYDTSVKQLYSMQTIYYRMLRGTKNAELPIPSLLEYFMIDNRPSLICIQHASIEMLTALFGAKAAPILWHEMQESDKPLTLERMQDICSQNGKIGLSEEFMKLFDLQSHHHHGGQKTLVQQDADVYLKQKVFIPS